MLPNQFATHKKDDVLSDYDVVPIVVPRVKHELMGTEEMSSVAQAELRNSGSCCSSFKYTCHTHLQSLSEEIG